MKISQKVFATYKPLKLAAGEKSSKNTGFLVQLYSVRKKALPFERGGKYIERVWVGAPAGFSP